MLCGHVSAPDARAREAGTATAMARDGLATWKDWSGKRDEVLLQAQSGIGKAHDNSNQCFLDLVVGDRGDQPMRLVFMLFEQTPLAFANFTALCTHSVGGLGEGGHVLHYRRSRITSIAKGSFFEGGDITLNDGRGGDSIFGAGGFECESFGLRLRHDTAGLLTMVPRHDHVQSRFRVTLGPTPELDGHCVIIGRLVSGAMHLPTIEALPVDAADTPTRPVSIVECGPIPGWSTLPPPMPPAPQASKATLAEVDSSAEALRGTVASAVKAALEKSDAAAAESADRGTKRGAAEQPAGASAKRSAGMMALPFEEEMGEDDDDDDD